MLINNATYQRETLSERPIRQPLSCTVVNVNFRYRSNSGQHWGIAYSGGARVGFPTWG